MFEANDWEVEKSNMSISTNDISFQSDDEVASRVKVFSRTGQLIDERAFIEELSLVKMNIRKGVYVFIVYNEYGSNLKVFTGS